MISFQERIALIGFGTMGAGLAQLIAQHGSAVIGYDIKEDALEIGLENIRSGKYGLSAAVASGKIGSDQVESIMSKIKTTTKLTDALQDSTFIIENVPEDLKLKQKIFQELDSRCDSHVLLATDTSGLSITEIAAEAENGDRIVGMHFFVPPQIMRLVEVIRGEHTGSEAVMRTKELAEFLGKTTIEVRDAPGFVVARLGILQFVEACVLVERGIATIDDIDLAVKLGLGHPMGPFELSDLVGLDTRLNILESMHQSTHDDKWKPPELLQQVVKAGYLGDPKVKKKSRGGFHAYSNDVRGKA